MDNHSRSQDTLPQLQLHKFRQSSQSSNSQKISFDDSPFLLSPSSSVIPFQVKRIISEDEMSQIYHLDQNVQLFSYQETPVQNECEQRSTYGPSPIPLPVTYLDQISPQCLPVSVKQYTAWSADSSSGDSVRTASSLQIDAGSGQECGWHTLLSNGGQRIVSAAEIAGLSSEEGSMNPNSVPPLSIDLTMEDLVQSVTNSVEPSKTMKHLRFHNSQRHRFKSSSRRGMPKSSVQQLAHWLCDNLLNPYPSRSEKSQLAEELGVEENQISNWFVNARTRFWKPLVHQVYEAHKDRLTLQAQTQGDMAVVEQLQQCDSSTNAPVLLSLMDWKAKKHLRQKVLSTFRQAGFLTLM